MLNWRALALSCLTLTILNVNEVPAQNEKKAQTNKRAQAKKTAKKKNARSDADKLLDPKPAPEREPLPQTNAIEFIKGERIAFLGNSTAERMSLFGHFESLLHARFPDKKLVIRNFGRPAEEVSVHQRSNDYTAIDDPMKAFRADTYICFFGWNESFAGVEGLGKFKNDYTNYLNELARNYPRDDKGTKPRFILVSPIAFEITGDRFLPDGANENQRLALYTKAVEEVAQANNVPFVNIFSQSTRILNSQPGMQYTINGCHLNEEGDKALALALDLQMFGSPNKGTPGSPSFERLRQEVIDKAWHHQQDYRMLNGWYVYGGRRTYDTETFPREYIKIRNMVAVRDERVWDLASGRSVPDVADDSKTGELFTPKTRFGLPDRKYSEADELRYLSPDDFIKSCTIPAGFEIKLFADETKFPDIAKPVQMNFDNKGRCWVSTMPSYPQWQPGHSKPNDKLVILTDDDGDGTADRSTVFYDKLHCPTGFEFFEGGVLVVDQPRLLWLKDTNGDDKADVVVHLFDGWASDDTHHSIGAFEFSHGGLLYMLEGIATSTTVETPWGPHRSLGSGGCYVVDPRTLKIRQFLLPGQYNSWCTVFDEWGQCVIGDGTTANQHWETPYSGARWSGRQTLNTIFNNEGMRPCIGSEFLISRNFPKEVQRQFIYSCVINMNGMPRFTVRDDGAGFTGARIKTPDNKPDDFIRSSDKHFRPVDSQIGPDGALWFGDWANALIGHMQYSQRDPNRDHVRGRVYRMYCKDGPKVTPVTQAGKSVTELMDQFSEYEWRTRQRARRELRARSVNEVLPQVATWLESRAKDAQHGDRYMLEALWIQQGHHRVDSKLLAKVLTCNTAEARAAAVRVLSDEADRIPRANEILRKMVEDPHPRVKVEAVRALSFDQSPESIAAILSVANTPMDYWTQYTVKHALGPTEGTWRQDFLTGKIGKGNAEVGKVLDDILATSKAGGQAAPHLRILFNEKSPEMRNKAMLALSNIKGNQNNGKLVFSRSCSACHKVGNDGKDFGPELTKIATKHNRMKLIESVVDPNAEVDKKYLATSVETEDGTVVTGLLTKESPTELEIFDGKRPVTIKVSTIVNRKALKQSSMPEGLAGAISPAEFLDVIEYLAQLKGN